MSSLLTTAELPAWLATPMKTLDEIFSKIAPPPLALEQDVLYVHSHGWHPGAITSAWTPGKTPQDKPGAHGFLQHAGWDDRDVQLLACAGTLAATFDLGEKMARLAQETVFSDEPSHKARGLRALIRPYAVAVVLRDPFVIERRHRLGMPLGLVAGIEATTHHETVRNAAGAGVLTRMLTSAIRHG